MLVQQGWALQEAGWAKRSDQMLPAELSSSVYQGSEAVLSLSADHKQSAPVWLGTEFLQNTHL